MPKPRIYSPFIFLLWSSSCFSVIVADIDLIDLPRSIPRKEIFLGNGAQDLYVQRAPDQLLKFNKHLRIAFFDTNTQEFVDVLGVTAQQSPVKTKRATPLRTGRAIYYLSHPAQEVLQPYSVTLTFPDWFSITCLYSQQQPHISLKVLPFTTNANTIRASRIIRYNGNVLSSPNNAALDLLPLRIQDESRPHLSVIASFITQEDPFPSPKNAQQICSFFNEFKGNQKDRGKNLEGYFYFGELQDALTPVVLKRSKINLKKIEKDQTLKTEKGKDQALKIEKGKIGELAADITMQSLSFCKKDAKYGGGKDNGFDGVYRRDDALFISDSKFFAETPNLEAVLNKDIYAMINTRLSNIEYEGSQKQKETAAYMREFMIRCPYNVYLLPYVLISDGKVKAMAKALREVHALLDPTKYTALLEMLFQNLTITPQQNPAKQPLANIPNQTHTNIQITPTEAYGYIEFFMQKFGMHGEYRLVRHEAVWSPITLESVRNPVIRLGSEDREYLKELISQIPQTEEKHEVERAVGEIGDSEHQHQVMKILCIVLENESENEKRSIIKSHLPWLIRGLSSCLRPTNYRQAKKLAALVFDLEYDPSMGKNHISDDFTLENRMVIFEDFLKSSHMVDEKSWDNFLFLYYKIHESICSLEIEPEETVSYLSDYVEVLKECPIDDLIDLINWIDEIYKSKCYSNLKGSHSSEDWMLLIKALQPLTPENRKILSEFIEWVPPSFNFGPADAIDEVLLPLLPAIDQLESFAVLEPLFIRAFELYEDQEDQKICLEEIIKGAGEKKNEKEIMRKIEKRLL